MDIPVDLDIVFLSSPFRSDKEDSNEGGRDGKGKNTKEMEGRKRRIGWKRDAKRRRYIYIYIEEGVVALVDFPFSYSI